MVRIGLIGVGNMGSAILNGPLGTHGPRDMIFSAAHRDKMEAVTARTEMPHTGSGRECAKAVKYLILTVKPQYFDTAFSETRDAVAPEQMVVSLTPGITISNTTERLGGNVRVVRAIPNTPATLEKGMTGISCREGSCTEEKKEAIRGIFSSCGRVEMVEERLMDAAGCVSDSSSAFVYMFIEALAGGGVRYDLPKKTAYAMAARIVPGGAKMILETGKHPGQLKDEVRSPGGATIAGVSTLEGHGLGNALIKATDACYEETQGMK